MEKLTRSKSKMITCIFMLCLLFGMNSCRKDFSRPIPDNLIKEQLIKEQTLNKWLETSEAAQVLTVDWRKAKQAIINGKNVVRIPTLFKDKISAFYNRQKTNDKQQSNIAGNTMKLRPLNYDYSHPPELFFIEDPATEKLSTFLLNFIPKDPGSRSDGIWTGKLYEWNLTGDTVFIQNIEHSKLNEKYVIKLNHSNINSQYSKSINGSGSKIINGFWGDLWDSLGEFVGWIGSAFGLSEHVWDWYDYEMEWRISVESKSSTGGAQTGGSPSDYGNYTSAGEPIYQSYLPGYNTGNNIEPPIFSAYPNQGNPNYIPESNAASYLLSVILLTPSQHDFLVNNTALSNELKAYLDENGLTENNKEYIKWAIGYFMENPSLTFSDLYENIIEDYDDPDNNIIVVVPSIFVNIPEKITLNNGKVVTISFGISDNKVSAKQKVHPKLLEALKTALNAAANYAAINSIFISATTNGVHAPDSKHYKGIGLDISRINGVQMIVSGNNIQVSSLQNAFEDLPNIRENFGPSFIHKNKLPASVSGHKDHIHITINL